MLTVRDATLDLLRRHQMTVLFGNPGSTEIPFLEGLPADFTYVMGLNEVVAASMADGYAQAARRPALVNLHSAVGLGNAMGALVNAAAARSPVVALVGQQARALISAQGLLANQHPHILPLGAVKFTAEPARAADVPAALAHAVHLAAQPPAGPVCVSVPMDDWQHEANDVAVRFTIPRRVVGGSVLDPQAAAELADRVGSAKRPALVIGHGMDTPTGFGHIAGLADRLGAPVWLAPFSARCGYPTGHAAFAGVLPWDARSAATALTGHDLVLALGCPIFRYYPHEPAPFLPEGADLIAVTADPEEASSGQAGDCFIGAPDTAVKVLLDQLPATPRPPMQRRQSPVPAPRAATQPGRLNADEVFATLADVLPPEAVIVNEALRQLPQFWKHVPLWQTGSFYLAGAAGLGFGLAGGIGVQLAHPERPVVIVLGDGSFQYTVQALWTAVQHNTPVTIVILNNQEYAILKDWGARLRTGPIPGVELPGIDLGALARGYGIPADRVTTTTGLRTQLTTAFDHPGPRIIEVALATTPYRWATTPPATTPHLASEPVPHPASGQ